MRTKGQGIAPWSFYHGDQLEGFPELNSETLDE